MASGQQEHQPSPENEGQEQRQDFQESPTIPLQNSEDPHTETAPHHLMDVDRHVQEQASRRAELHTPEPRTSNDRLNGHRDHTDRSPSTPGHLAPFDWDDFESRYEQALAEANNEEKELLEEFERLVKYFNVWASAASVHDNERGIKRLQTRERYVKIAEQSLVQKKKHLTEVVRAFQSALALLSQS